MAKGTAECSTSRKWENVTDEDEGRSPIDRSTYHRELYELQVELVKLQKYLIRHNGKLLLLFEGRDAAGKDGTIKRIVEHLSPRETRVVALGKPSDRERRQWYFQRFVAHLPGPQELVCFNRSWYNRAGVERVMGYCTGTSYEEFIETVPAFEQMLVRSGITLVKYYFDITKAEQRRRLKNRRKDPLKQWKLSPVDAAALAHWNDYSQARNEMFARTHTAVAPWTVVRADDKRTTRLNVIRDVLRHIPYKGRRSSLTEPDPTIVFLYDESRIVNGDIAP